MMFLLAIVAAGVAVILVRGFEAAGGAVAAKRGQRAAVPTARGAASPSLPRPLPSEGSRVSRGAVAALARAEGRHLLLHPVFVGGLVMTALGARIVVSWENYGGLLVALGLPVITTAVASLVTANLAVLRARRNGVEELFDSLPMDKRARTAGHLLSTGWALVAAAIAVLAVAFFAGAFNGEDVRFVEGVRSVMPSAFALAQGPLAVVVLATLGIFIATWIPRSLVLVPGAFFLLFVGIGGATGDKSRWFMPPAGNFDAQPDSPYALLRAPEVAPMGWHLLYLAGAIALLAAGALVRHVRDRRVGTLAVVGVGAAAAGGTMQWITTTLPWT